MSRLVSVCIPTYRQPALAERAIGSALEQRGCALEVVITDDSPDDAVERLVAARFKDDRVHYHRNAVRLGAVANWNECIRRSQGAVKKILHHDDWFCRDDALAQFAEPILAGKAKVVFSACNSIRTDKTPDRVHVATPEQIASYMADPRSILFGNFLGAPSVVAFCADMRSRFDPRYLWVSDMEFYARIGAEASGQVIYLREPMLNVSADLPSQITRRFENNAARSFMEFASAVSEAGFSGRDRVRAVAFLDGLSGNFDRDRLGPLAWQSALKGNLRLAWMLATVMWAGRKR